MIYAFCTVAILLIASVIFNILLFCSYDTIREAYDNRVEELKLAEYERDNARQALLDLHIVYGQEIKALRRWKQN